MNKLGQTTQGEKYKHPYDLSEMTFFGPTSRKRNYYNFNEQMINGEYASNMMQLNHQILMLRLD